MPYSNKYENPRKVEPRNTFPILFAFYPTGINIQCAVQICKSQGMCLPIYNDHSPTVFRFYPAMNTLPLAEGAANEQTDIDIAIHSSNISTVIFQGTPYVWANI